MQAGKYCHECTLLRHIVYNVMLLESDASLISIHVRRLKSDCPVQCHDIVSTASTISIVLSLHIDHGHHANFNIIKLILYVLSLINNHIIYAF